MKTYNPDPKQFQTPEFKSIIQKELDGLKKDELVYPFIQNELKITQKEANVYIAALLDYQEDVHYCANCPGLDKCNKNNPHFTMTLRREFGVIARHYDPCVKMRSLSSFYERYIVCSFNPDWRDATLQDIATSVSSRNTVIAQMSKIAAGLLNDRWLYLTGSNGSGKSYMLACFANFITTNKGKGAFCDATQLIEELKGMSINDKDGFESRMKELREASILVLDDFGNEFKTEYSFTSILYPLLSYRAKEGKLTCFASDFKIDQIGAMYQAKIGPERASQFKELLKYCCKKEYDVTGVRLG